MHNDSILDITEILNDYSTEIQEAICIEAQNIAKKGRDTLRYTSPKRTGAYRRGWTVSTTKGRNTISCVIHNKTHYRLTHLLEHEHAVKNKYGSWGTYYPTKTIHIEPVNKECNNEFEKAVENIIKNGG